MNSVFPKLIEMSIGAAWFISAIILAHPLLDKLPKNFSMLMWEIAGLRLILPLQVESAFSLIPKRASAASITQIAYQSFTAEQANPLPTPTVVSGNEALSLLDTPTTVWLCGCVMMIMYAIISTLLLKRRLASAVILCDNIKQSENIGTAFVTGIFRPTIYLPYGISGEYIRLIIAHEKNHICRGDHIVKLLGYLILSVYWFNPFVWAAYIFMCRDIEAACDECVAATLSFKERKVYAMAMLEFEEKTVSFVPTPVAFSEKSVKNRVKRVLRFKKPPILVICLSAVICALVVVCLLTAPKVSALETDIPQESVEEVMQLVSDNYGNTPDDVIGCLNEIRALYGLDGYRKGGDALYRAAELRAEECVGQYSHERPDGRSFSTALDESGVIYSCCDELIGFGQENARQFALEAYCSGNLDQRCDTLAVASSKTADGTNIWIIELISD